MVVSPFTCVCRIQQSTLQLQYLSSRRSSIVTTYCSFYSLRGPTYYQLPERLFEVLLNSKLLFALKPDLDLSCRKVWIFVMWWCIVILRMALTLGTKWIQWCGLCYINVTSLDRRSTPSSVAFPRLRRHRWHLASQPSQQSLPLPPLQPPPAPRWRGQAVSSK